MKIKKIEVAGTADVYNMEVEEIHDFVVENGVVAHNCYDECRYVLMMNPIAPRANVADKVPEYDPLDLYKDRQRDTGTAFYRI